MADHLVSMKSAVPSQDELDEVEKPEFPWGLSLNLDDAVMNRLGMKTLPSVGQTMNIKAVAKVTSVSEHDNEDSGVRRTVSLQITDMEVPTKTTEDEKATALFGKGDD